MFRSVARALSLAGATALAISGCGGNGDGEAGAGERPMIVVTTTILGDIVANVVGDAAQVEVVMPIGADPHEFAPSAQQATAMSQADLLVVNGLGFEEGLAGAIEAAGDEGVEVFAFADSVDTIAFDEGEDEGGHDDPDGDHDHDHDHEGDDPHIWTDPVRMAEGVDDLAERIAALEGVDADAVTGRAGTYADELRALDAEIAGLLAGIPDDRRTLVTNHEVFGYFADRYGFEVVGTVVPAGTTLAEPSAADVAELAEVIRDEGVPAIFAETTASANLAEALADDVGDVEVVELFTESLGEPGSGAETYIELLRSDAELILAALG